MLNCGREKQCCKALAVLKVYYVRMVGGDVCSQCQLIFNVLTEIYDMGTGENHFAPTSSNVIVVVGIRNITYMMKTLTVGRFMSVRWCVFNFPVLLLISTTISPEQTDYLSVSMFATCSTGKTLC